MKLGRIAALLAVLILFAAVSSCGVAEQPAPSLQLLTAAPTLFATGSAAGDTTPTPAPTAPPSSTPAPDTDPPQTPAPLDEGGVYDGRDEVALYILLYGHLPSNYITKKEAQALGWSGGSLQKIAPGKCIGGDYFGNYEGALPKKKGRRYTECDIGTLGRSSRGSKRLVFSNDGLIFYTDDHYESFTLLYGEAEG